MIVSDWMTKDPITLEASAPIKEAVGALLTHRIRHVLILDGGKLVGIVSDRDIKRALPSLAAGTSPAAYQKFMDETRVDEVMTAKVQTCTRDTDVVEVVRHFCNDKIGAMPVVDGDEVVGIVTQTDVMRSYLEELEGK